MILKYQKMSLFDAPQGSLLVHACNCKGVWGSGIALTFKQRFPVAYSQYASFCQRNNRLALGRGVFFPDGAYQIGCLMTSYNYGKYADSPLQILEETRLSVKELLKNTTKTTIYSPKFNSGLFRVPWSQTENVLKNAGLDFPQVTWIICIQ